MELTLDGNKSAGTSFLFSVPTRSIALSRLHLNHGDDLLPSERCASINVLHFERNLLQEINY